MKSWLNEPENLALREPPGWKTLQAFVAVDLALIIVHVVNRATVDYRFPRIDIELGLGEIYQYGKFAVLVAVMVDVSRRSHTWSPLLWSLVFAYLLVDDALGLHEALGAVFGRALDRPPGETSIQILADLTIAAGVASIVLIAHRTRALSRRASVILIVGLVAFGMFAGGADALSRLGVVMERRSFRGLMAVIEEGGEMLSVSLMVWFTLMIRRDLRTVNRP